MARIPVRDPRNWAFAMTRLPVRFHKTEQAYEDWRKRPIEGEWLYIWVDGIYSKMRKESDRLC
ncbi:MAG: hypothetical protein ACYCRD_10715, partial [Leptospirillum sp.]